MDGHICYFFGFALLIVLVVGAVASWQARKLREAMQQFAQERGLHFEPSDDRDAPGRMPMRMFDEFTRGRGRKCFNQLAGDLQADGAVHALVGGCLQYKTTSGTGKNRKTRTHNFTYLLVFLPHARSSIWVRPEHFFDRMASAVGFNDLDFESVEFSDAFHVKADDERFCYDLFHPPMIEMMLRRRPPGFRIEHGWLALIAGGSRGPEWFGPSLDFAADLLANWPRHLKTTEAA